MAQFFKILGYLIGGIVGVIILLLQGIGNLLFFAGKKTVELHQEHQEKVALETAARLDELQAKCLEDLLVRIKEFTLLLPQAQTTTRELVNSEVAQKLSMDRAMELRRLWEAQPTAEQLEDKQAREIVLLVYQEELEAAQQIQAGLEALRITQNQLGEKQAKLMKQMLGNLKEFYTAVPQQTPPFKQAKALPAQKAAPTEEKLKALSAALAVMHDLDSAFIHEAEKMLEGLQHNVLVPQNLT